MKKIILVLALFVSSVQLVNATSSNSGFAIFDTEDLAVGDQFTYDGSDLYVNPRELQLDFSFLNTGTEKELKITLNNVLEVASFPGLKKNATEGWEFDASTLPTQLQTSVVNVVYTPEKYNGYLTGRGIVVYQFDDSTTAVEMSFLLKLNGIYGYAGNYVNPLEVEATYNDGTSTVMLEQANIAGISILDDTGTVSTFRELDDVATAVPGEEITLRTDLQQKIEGESGVTFNGYIVKRLEVVFSIPKVLGFTDLYIDSSGGTVSGGGSLTYSVDSTTDADNDLVTMVIDGLYTIDQINFVYNVSETIEEGVYRATQPISYKVTLPDDTEFIEDDQSKISILSFTNYIKISLNDTLTAEVSNRNYSFQNFKTTSILGTMRVENGSSLGVSNQRGSLDFREYVNIIGVEALEFKTIAGISNISYETNLGKTGSITDNFSSVNVKINKSTLGITSPNEYITYIEFDYNGVFPGGWTASNVATLDNYFYSHSVIYFGKVLALPGDKNYDVKYTVEDTTSPGSKKEFVQSHSINLIKKAALEVPTNIYSGNDRVNINAGSTYTIVASTDISQSKSVPGLVTDLVGVAFYIRETSYASIDEGSISVEYDGNIYSAGDGNMNVVKGIDNKGAYFYKVELPNVHIGYVENKLPVPTLSYDFTTNLIAPTITAPAYDMVIVTPLNTTIKAGNNNNAASSGYTGYDYHNVTGQNDQNYEVAVPLEKEGINILAQFGAVIETTANFNGSPWTYYNQDINQYNLVVNPGKEIGYRVSAVNNLGSDFVDGFISLTPIPKKGEQTIDTPVTEGDYDKDVHTQIKQFEWSASITEEPTASIAVGNSLINFTYEYSTSYVNDPSDASFTTWNNIANKEDIRMVKISTSDVFPKDYAYDIVIPMEVTETDLLATASTTNIYSSIAFDSVTDTTNGKITQTVSLELQSGVISGTVFNDANKNGLQDVGELGEPQVTVIALNNITRDIVDSVLTNANGYYEFNSLTELEEYDIKFINNSTTDKHFSPVTAGGSTPTASTDHSSAIKSRVIANAPGFDEIDAGFIGPSVITFDTQGGIPASFEETGFLGESVSSVLTPTKTGYRFIGWSTDIDGQNLVSFPLDFANQDFTVYAQYEVDGYSVTYIVDGNEYLVEAYVVGNLITAPDEPIKKGHTFIGWEKNDKTFWDFESDTMPSKDIVLTAKFSVNEYTVTFDIDGKLIIENHPYGEIFDAPLVPVKDGYKFIGWQDTDGNIYTSTSGTMPDYDLYLVAIFEPVDQTPLPETGITHNVFVTLLALGVLLVLRKLNYSK